MFRRQVAKKILLMMTFNNIQTIRKGNNKTNVCLYFNRSLKSVIGLLQNFLVIYSTLQYPCTSNLNFVASDNNKVNENDRYASRLCIYLQGAVPDYDLFCLI